jgi:hypothetical protein
MKRRTLKKREARNERRMWVALKHVRDQHNYAWRAKPTIIGFVPVMKSIGMHCEVTFGYAPLPDGLYPDRMAEFEEAIGGDDGS